jgi:hypothetical protein
MTDTARDRLRMHRTQVATRTDEPEVRDHLTAALGALDELITDVTGEALALPAESPAFRSGRVLSTGIRRGLHSFRNPWAL